MSSSQELNRLNQTSIKITNVKEESIFQLTLFLHHIINTNLKTQVLKAQLNKTHNKNNNRSQFLAVLLQHNFKQSLHLKNHN